jgi:hypothetical protein
LPAIRNPQSAILNHGPLEFLQHSANRARANRLWQFDAKGGGFRFGPRTSTGGRAAAGATSPNRGVHLWQPKLNVAWLPPENVFLRVIELPKSNFEETLAMVELQLEKLSPMPVTQIVWTIHVLPQRRGAAAICRQSSSSSPREMPWRNFSANWKIRVISPTGSKRRCSTSWRRRPRRRRRVDLSPARGGKSAALVGVVERRRAAEFEFHCLCRPAATARKV